MFFKRREKHKIFPIRKGIDVSDNFCIGKYRNIQVLSTTSKLFIGSNVIFREFCNILLMNNSLLRIGNNVFFNNYCSINCLGEIEIGQNTIFGEGVRIYDHNHVYCYDNNILQVEREKFSIGSIKVGKNCWIGSNVTILNNVEIGDNVIVGANCFIYKSIPSNSIVKHSEVLNIEQKND